MTSSDSKPAAAPTRPTDSDGEVPEGFRSGYVVDPFGHLWMIQHQTETVTPQQMQERMDALPPDCQN